MSVTPAARNGLRFEVWDYLKERWRIWRMFSALSIFVGTGIISYIWWNNNGSISVQDKVLQTFEEGGIPHWNSVFEDDAFATIKRPEIEKKLEEFFYSTGKASYILIMGEHGTGKSTAVRHVVCDFKGINGAIYVNVPTDISKFGELLSNAVGFTSDIEMFDAEGGVRRRINATTKEENKPEPSREPMATWSLVSDSIKVAAMMFRKKHGRPAILIIDSAERIAKKNPEFLAELQDFAKDRTDEGNLRVVFVSSDGSVLQQLKSRSAWSRAFKPPYEVGDIFDKDAVDFLKGKGVEENQAIEAVMNITGGRFELLYDYVAAYKVMGNKSTYEQLFKETILSLRLAGLEKNHEFFKILVTNQSIDDDPARILWKDKFDSTMKILREKNIIAAHPNLTYTFHSRYVETFFKKVFENERGEE